MIGREEERRILKDAADSDRSQFIVVYGRRRVGKTYLIRETFDYSFTFSHTGIEGASMHEQLEAFRESLVEQGLPDADCPKNWIEAFSLLKKLLKSGDSGRKVVFIDELPWMDTPRSKFVRALENFWNGWCSARKDIVLIVCGSATSWMIRTVSPCSSVVVCYSTVQAASCALSHLHCVSARSTCGTGGVPCRATRSLKGTWSLVVRRITGAFWTSRCHLHRTSTSCALRQPASFPESSGGFIPRCSGDPKGI